MSVLPMGPRVGPWLPNVRTAPASYAGPLVYGSGLVFAAQDAWEAFYALRYDGAPRDITTREAEAVAAREYDSRGCAMLSGGSDGGMHWRGDAYSAGAARGWAEEKRRAMVRRIMAGECRWTIFYDRHRDAFYCG